MYANTYKDLDSDNKAVGTRLTSVYLLVTSPSHAKWPRLQQNKDAKMKKKKTASD